MYFCGFCSELKKTESCILPSPQERRTVILIFLIKSVSYLLIFVTVPSSYIHFIFMLLLF